MVQEFKVGQSRAIGVNQSSAEGKSSKNGSKSAFLQASRELGRGVPSGAIDLYNPSKSEPFRPKRNVFQPLGKKSKALLESLQPKIKKLIQKPVKIRSAVLNSNQSRQLYFGMKHLVASPRQQRIPAIHEGKQLAPQQVAIQRVIRGVVTHMEVIGNSERRFDLNNTETFYKFVNSLDKVISDKNAFLFEQMADKDAFKMYFAFAKQAGLTALPKKTEFEV